MASQFSSDGKYFAQITTDGKLKVWDAASGSFEQEFVPDFHLTSPCTCLHFVERLESGDKVGSPRKKIKRRLSQDVHTSPYLVLGTSSGSLLVYSIAKGNLEYKIHSGTSQCVSCVSWSEGNLTYAGAEQLILCFDLETRSIKSKWKSSNEKITAILALPESDRILTASKSIKLWDVSSREVIKTFTGHSHEVSVLHFIPPRENASAYFISASKGERTLSCWSLNEKSRDKNSVVTFNAEEVCSAVSVVVAPDDTTTLAAVTRSGIVHIYRHTPNGKCAKPVKPRVTIQVVSDTGQTDSIVSPIPIVGAIFKANTNLTIGYGNSLFLRFEDVVLNDYEKIQCLIRKDPRKVSSTSKAEEVSKTRAPVVDGDVSYLTPYTLTADVKEVKRKNQGRFEVPMEKRLENLQLNKLENGAKVPKVDNVAQLLVQGLHSKDKNIMRSVLSNKDETVVRNTVKRLPMAVIVPLVQELTALIQGKTGLSQIGALWLKNLLQAHAGLLLSNPELPDLLGPTLGSIQNRLSLHTPLSGLRGRLDLLVSQLSEGTDSKEANQENEAVLLFNDALSDDASDIMEVAVHSDSDNEWMEESSEEGNEEEEGEQSDEEMST